jgi:hypothetical protein
MASRAVHIEVAASLETDSFINALRRFLSRRGPIRQLRSDQGTNFVGAKKELKDALRELDPKSPNPLTPNHLLTMKTKVLLSPPGVFQSADMYCRRRWRRVQHLANEFWIRWRREYLLTLQERQKWNKPRQNSRVGDIVLIKGDDQVSRNKWQLAKVVEIYESSDGHVRSGKLMVADGSLDAKGKRTKPVRFLERPVQKLVLLQEEEEIG